MTGNGDRGSSLVTGRQGDRLSALSPKSSTCHQMLSHDSTHMILVRSTTCVKNGDSHFLGDTVSHRNKHLLSRFLPWMSKAVLLKDVDEMDGLPHLARQCHVTDVIAYGVGKKDCAGARKMSRFCQLSGQVVQVPD
jgi:hypothetical protein